MKSKYRMTKNEFEKCLKTMLTSFEEFRKDVNDAYHDPDYQLRIEAMLEHDPKLVELLKDEYRSTVEPVNQICEYLSKKLNKKSELN